MGFFPSPRERRKCYRYPNDLGRKKEKGLFPRKRLSTTINSNVEGLEFHNPNVEQVRICSRLLGKPIKVVILHAFVCLNGVFGSIRVTFPCRHKGFPHGFDRKKWGICV